MSCFLQLREDACTPMWLHFLFFTTQFKHLCPCKGLAHFPSTVSAFVEIHVRGRACRFSVQSCHTTHYVALLFVYTSVRPWTPDGWIHVSVSTQDTIKKIPDSSISTEDSAMKKSESLFQESILGLLKSFQPLQFSLSLKNHGRPQLGRKLE